MQLFREEALKHSERRLEGSVILAVPLRTKALSLSCLAVISTGFLFAAFANYEQRVSASGILLPSRGLVRINAQSAGVVDHLFVQEGNVLGKGDPIAKVAPFDRSLASANGKPIDPAAVAREIIATEETAILSREQADLGEIEAAVRSQRNQIIALRAQLLSVDNRAGLLKKTVVNAERELERARQLAARGFLSNSEVSRREDAQTSAQAELENVRINRITTLDMIAQLEGAITSQRQKQAARKAEALQALAGLEARRAEVSALEASIITAPIAGRVSTLPTYPGQSIRPEATLAVLVPENDPLELEIFVPVAAAGLLQVGQRIRINYDAFPFQKFGVGTGTLRNISASVLRPGEVREMPEQLKTPSVRIRARIDRQFVNGYGIRHRLRPGMTAQVDFTTSNRSLLQWIFDPIVALGRSL